MLEDYDKKKNFIKEEMQAIKQKNSLYNFSTSDCSLNQQQSTVHKTTVDSFYKDHSLDRSKYETLDQKLKTIQAEFSYSSGFKGSFSDKKDYSRTDKSALKLK